MDAETHEVRWHVELTGATWVSGPFTADVARTLVKSIAENAEHRRLHITAEARPVARTPTEAPPPK